ncbi:hypothetical protein [Micromonospora sagamiensis]|uniref:Uncharacterized protein n=1 Tax=Micromonospora sagamiensis TaxID=47875 RepID=A0A562WNS8_9ACTN|nr:hypothetical protein [Micromonospora sagamiensis]TWJ31939.1 hypothetical protein JD81_05505 [Micromonospora sagamiensis]BCL15007.1 hypothetical protein GCM10017556_27460 [Micromonospora sagamiensis]
MAETHSTPARARPGSVTISSYLLILVAVIQVINLVLTLATIGDTRRVLEEAYRDSSVNGMDAVADFATVVAVGAGIVTLLLAVGLVVLAVLNNRGKNGARITTWVLGGILLCCSGGGLISGAAGSFSGPVGGSSADMPSQEEIARRLEEALPSWYTPVSTLVNVLAVLALIAALVLLALPASNQFFRKQQPAWEPPVPGAYPGYPSGTPGYPTHGQPGYPPAPGYPGQTPSGQPGYPTQGQPGYPPAPGYPPPSGTGQPEQPPAGGSDGPSGDQNPPADRPPSAG